MSYLICSLKGNSGREVWKKVDWAGVWDGGGRGDGGASVGCGETGGREPTPCSL